MRVALAWYETVAIPTMEAKLQSYKVAELKELLQAADLSTSGNKPDLIKRLLENPEATKSLESSEGEAAPQPAEAPKQETPAPAAGPTPDTASKNTESVKPAMPSDTERKNALLAELEKRKARAIRFGQPYEDVEKQILRIQKFGLEEDVRVDRLDTELKKDKGKRSVPAKPAPAASAEPEVDVCIYLLTPA